VASFTLASPWGKQKGKGKQSQGTDVEGHRRADVDGEKHNTARSVRIQEEAIAECGGRETTGV
jgi:hypothetical protein